MRFGYTIVYVPNVDESLRFFTAAFGLARKFLHESATYGELDTGETTLAFASHELGAMNFPAGHVSASASVHPLGVEIAPNAPLQFAADIKADMAKWDQLIKSLGIRLD